MKKEIEIKFKIENLNLIKRKLKDKKAKFIGKTLERTIKFDTENKDLEKKGKFLRVRTGFKNVITFKRKIKRKDTKFKEREEIELEIPEPEKMKIILENLGFTKKWIMEKYREKWILGDAEVVIDKLPKMGNFIEIEGSKKSIQETAKVLGLNFEDRITATYWGLWEDYRKTKGIKNENIVLKKYKILSNNNCWYF